MTVSFVGNQQLAREAQATANAAINTRPQTAVAWRAQLALQAVLGPGATVKLSAPMTDDVQAVGVVGFFRDQDGATWQLVIPKSQWKKTDPVKLIVTGNQIELGANH
ncbi:type VI secretion lipoprotein TssJ [Burkholderia vietnamiensis]|uniref:type VI secretion lipoprotein TssJ n=1 Tax=Burkholderia vietnamiensis TaxID=60552 RepID=UPI002011579B|nr:type VI secretion lipoprotein TssJ [Burkholderia vietnamiensis]